MSFDPMANGERKFYLDRVVSEKCCAFLLGGLRHFAASVAFVGF